MWMNDERWSKALLACLVFLVQVLCTFTLAPQPPASEPGADGDRGFDLAGLTSPAVVAESIFVQAPELPSDCTVIYLLDGRSVWNTSKYPFWLGGEEQERPHGFSLANVPIGKHQLRAVANINDHQHRRSRVIELKVIPSENHSFSRLLQPYLDQLTAHQKDLATILEKTSTIGAWLTVEETKTRARVLTMYINWGIDPSLDSDHDESDVLLKLRPKNWARAPKYVPGTPLSMLFSSDAPFYHPIPMDWPKVLLPSRYVQNVQLNTSIGGDGIGFGEIIAESSDPMQTLRSQWYSLSSTLRLISFPIPLDWEKDLPSNRNGDRHMIFVDAQRTKFVSSYQTRRDAVTGMPTALYASWPVKFDTLGDAGGATAAKFAELPLLIQPGEVTNLKLRMQHAIGGPVHRVWAARVYPATAWDAGVRAEADSCRHFGPMNTGVVPYGGVIQLDPSLDLSRIKLSLPALRILQAMQTYGYYVMDFGCADMDIYTAIAEAELNPFGGLWGNKNGLGVQKEINQVITTQKLFVTVPLTKKQ